MVKCYTKKKSDGGSYTTCIGFQAKSGKTKPKAKPKSKSKLKGKTITIKRKIKKKKVKPTAKGVMTIQKKIKGTKKLKNKSTIKPVISKPKAKPKAKILSAGKAVLMGLPINMKTIGQYVITKSEKERREKLRIYKKIFPKKDMVNVRQLLGVYGLMETFVYRIPHQMDGEAMYAEAENGRKLRDRVYKRKGMTRMTSGIGKVMDDQMRTKSNHKYIKEVMSFNGFMIWFYEVGYYLKQQRPNAKIWVHTPFYDTPDFEKGEGLFKSFSSREFLLKMPEIYARFGGVPNATPKLINGNIDLRIKTTKKGFQKSYDEALEFLKNVHKHKRIR
tara:strand:- start:378 stop:1370 length:993 start_codon:yes stop_codon:yes gene_type:complete